MSTMELLRDTIDGEGKRKSPTTSRLRSKEELGQISSFDPLMKLVNKITAANSPDVTRLTYSV